MYTALGSNKVSIRSGLESPVTLQLDDYLLGVFDMVGELMRFAITTMATTGELPRASASSAKSLGAEAGGIMERTVLADMRELRGWLEKLDIDESPFSRDVEKKMPVMRQSVEKIENAAYGLIVRGSERPKGWMPDIEGGREVESY